MILEFLCLFVAPPTATYIVYYADMNKLSKRLLSTLGSCPVLKTYFAVCLALMIINCFLLKMVHTNGQSQRAMLSSTKVVHRVVVYVLCVETL